MPTDARTAARRRYSEATWGQGISALKQFCAREGHYDVPRFHIEGTYRLGQWVAVQRYYYFKNIIAPARKAQLDALGFMWSRCDWLWEINLAALKAFKAREGHCQVHARHIEGGLKLGYWVSTQRRKKSKMNDERIQRLDDAGFVWRVNARAKPRPRSGFDRHDVPVPALSH
jgi:hypothetical protein